ncbi:Uncharacterized protein APZ42_005986 [Daphnia magna]|uniref:Uncharacterized protein n=1 Tax=Daphnia magna TaxID=35525 RepID=A0A164G565_9CRUS|nr:Uncharacterized protein APZ42_005986 [Daphnia magna]
MHNIHRQWIEPIQAALYRVSRKQKRQANRGGVRILAVTTFKGARVVTAGRIN